MHELIRQIKEAEAHYQLAHETAEHIYRTSGKCAEHGAAVAARDRAESAIKSLRAQAYLMAAAAVERATQAATRPIYLQPAGLSERVTDVDPFDPNDLPF